MKKTINPKTGKANVKNDNIDKLWCLIFGIAGGLIGFGCYGTVSAACLGAGIGLVSPFIVILVLLCL